MPSMTGVFQLISSENYDEYLKSIGVDMLMRNLLCDANPAIGIYNEGLVWNIITGYTFSTNEISFRLGVDFDEDAIDGRTCRSLIVQEGDDKLVQLQRDVATGKTPRIVRQFTDTEMIMTMQVPGDIISTHTFQKE